MAHSPATRAARDRQCAQAEPRRRTDRSRQQRIEPQPAQADEHRSPQRRCRDVDFAAQEYRWLIRQHVADDAAEGRGQHAHHHLRQRRHAVACRLGRADDRISRHPDGIEPQQRRQPPAVSAEQPYQARHHQADTQYFLPPDPEHRRPDQQVAQSTTADAGHRREEREGDDVLSRARRRQRPRYRKHRHSGHVEQFEQRP